MCTGPRAPLPPAQTPCACRCWLPSPPLHLALPCGSASLCPPGPALSSFPHVRVKQGGLGASACRVCECRVRSGTRKGMRGWVAIGARARGRGWGRVRKRGQIKMRSACKGQGEHTAAAWRKEQEEGGGRGDVVENLPNGSMCRVCARRSWGVPLRRAQHWRAPGRQACSRFASPRARAASGHGVCGGGGLPLLLHAPGRCSTAACVGVASHAQLCAFALRTTSRNFCSGP